ncbi:unnamed protein product [Vitrella brassicaformis CCMP3155]|uniref:DUF4211 domain-containing protein n=2 Tax=Vitrella brassicaformis TaxID=1169539 RepID=A0A0G4E8A4_VITBC|nr:unnamed protein product [Vitrella brassicaformis CCMP3155]|eukprot:CEL91604.1 unnamed protein product [Vitrella brassicaformis CCMP3155]
MEASSAADDGKEAKRAERKRKMDQLAAKMRAKQGKAEDDDDSGGEQGEGDEDDDGSYEERPRRRPHRTATDAPRKMGTAQFLSHGNDLRRKRNEEEDCYGDDDDDFIDDDDDAIEYHDSEEKKKRKKRGGKAREKRRAATTNRGGRLKQKKRRRKDSDSEDSSSGDSSDESGESGGEEGEEGEEEGENDDDDVDERAMYMRSLHEEPDRRRGGCDEDIDPRKAFKRYVEYLCLLTLSPTFDYDAYEKQLQQEEDDDVDDENDAPKGRAYYTVAEQRVEDKLRTLQHSQLESRFTKDVTDRLCRRPQFFYYQLGRAQIDRLREMREKCVACHRSRPPPSRSILMNGTQYDSEALWEGDIRPFMEAFQLPWLGQAAFPDDQDPFKSDDGEGDAMDGAGDPATIAYPFYTQGARYSNPYDMQNEYTHVAHPEDNAEDRMLVGSTCGDRMRRWHYLQHYKAKLLWKIHTELESMSSEMRKKPLSAAKTVRTSHGEDWWKEYEAYCSFGAEHGEKGQLATDTWMDA